MRCNSLLIWCAVFSTLAAPLQAQEEEELGTETVTVVRSYTPSVSDAYKIKKLPGLRDSIVLQKQPIRYSIFSVPVASTFTPAKGKAAAVERSAPEKRYDGSAAVGLGNYNNALAEVYLGQAYDRGRKRLDLGLNHFSSRGDIEDTPLDTDFYNTDLDLTYAQRERDWDWSAAAGLEYRRYNWYGLPEGVFDAPTIAGIDEAQDYFGAELRGKIHMEDTYFTDAQLLARRFWDATESAENRIQLGTDFSFPLTEEALNMGLEFDYLDGSFANADQASFANTGGIAYRYLITGIRPSLLMLRDNLKLELGARIVVGLDLESSDTDFFIYPSVTASYRLLDEKVIAYGGVEGGLLQNSYYDFSHENPFVAPTLQVRPTDRQYEAYLGVKGQLAPSVSYGIKGSYRAENFLPLYILNPQNESRNDEKGYHYGNSFRIFYDDVKTLGIHGDLEFSLNRNFTLGLQAAVYDYDTETDNPAWNLPDLEGSLTLDYQHDSGWFFGANLFYMGSREDFSSVALENTNPELYPATLLSLDAFFDANAHLGYRINDQLSVFARGSNLAGNTYQRWAGFRVQGLQVLAGLRYQFDL